MKRLLLLIIVLLIALTGFFIYLMAQPSTPIESTKSSINTNPLNISLTFNQDLVWSSLNGLITYQGINNNSIINNFENYLFTCLKAGGLTISEVALVTDLINQSINNNTLNDLDLKTTLNQSTINNLAQSDKWVLIDNCLSISAGQSINNYLTYPNDETIINDYQSINNSNPSVSEMNYWLLSEYGMPTHFYRVINESLNNYSTTLNNLNNQVLINQQTTNNLTDAVTKLLTSQGFNLVALNALIDETIPNYALNVFNYLTCSINQVLNESITNCPLKTPLINQELDDLRILKSIPNPEGLKLDHVLLRPRVDLTARREATVFEARKYYYGLINYTIIIAQGINDYWLNCSDCYNETINQVTVRCNPTLNHKNQELNINLSEWYYCDTSEMLLDMENEFLRQELLNLQTKLITLSRPINILRTNNYENITHCENNTCYKLVIESTIQNHNLDLTTYFINSINQLT